MSPRTSDKNEEIREQSKKALLDSAFKLFAKNGYEKTSIASIAKEAGVSKGLVYNYFASKEDLLIGIFESMVEQFEYIWTFDQNEDPKNILRTMLDQTFTFIETQQEFSRMMFMLIIQKDAMDRINHYIEQIQQGKLEFIAPVFEKLGYDNPLEEAYFMGAMLDGTGFGFLARGKDYPLENIKKRIYSHYKL